MRQKTWIGRSVIALLVLGLIAAAPAGVAETRASQASRTVTSADLQRLQDELDSLKLAADRVEKVRDEVRFDSDLDLLQEELIYLRVKLRKEGSVRHSEYAALQSEIADARARLNRVNVQTDIREARTIPTGTEMDVVLQTALDSDTAEVEDRFEVTTAADLFLSDELLIPEGSRITGTVSAVDEATRTDRTSSLTLAFEEITVRGVTYPVRMTVTKALKAGGVEAEAGRVGIGAGIGGIIGGILGGVRGAVTGILVGAGGTIAATEGKNVELPVGTVLRVKLTAPLTLRPTSD